MSPPPPSKISLKHEWKRELGSDHAQRAEAGQLSRSFQSNQPTLNPIHETSGRLDITHDVIGVQDERKTSRSQEIDVNSFCEQPSSSERTERLLTGPIPGKPVHETSVIQTRSSEEKRISMLNSHMSEQGDLLSRMTWLSCQIVLKHVLLMKAKRSTLEMKHFVRERKDPLLIMTWVMSQWWWRRRTWTSEFQDYRIPSRRVPAFENWFRKLRTIQIDMLFNKIYGKTNHLIPSVQNQNKWFRMWVTSNYVNCSRRNPKRSAQRVYRTGIPVWSTARAGIPEYVIKKGRPHGHRYGKKPGDKEYYTANQLKKCKKKYFQGIHDRFLRDQEFRTRVIENHRDEDLCRRWDALAGEDHTPFDGTRIPTHTVEQNGGFIQISKFLILCHWGIDLISSRHCLLCSKWNRKKQELRQINNGHRVLLLHGGVGKVLGGLLFLWKSPWRWTKYWLNKATCYTSIWKQFFKAWFSWIHLLCYRWIVYSWRRSTVTDGGCKYHTSNDVSAVQNVCKKWLHGKVMMNCYSMITRWEFGHKVEILWLGDKAQRERQWQHLCLRGSPWHGHQWQHLWLRGTAQSIHHWPLPLSVVRILAGSVVLSSSAHPHAPWPKFESFMSSPCAWSSVRSFHFDPPFLFLALLSAPFPLPQLREVCGKPAQLLQREYGLHRRVLPFHRLWAQGPRLLRDLSRALHGALGLAAALLQ